MQERIVSPCSTYRVLSRIGEGTFAHVFLVKRISPGKPAQLLVMKRRKTAARSAKEARDMLREADLLRETSRHPCVIGYKEAFLSPSGGLLCIVMEHAAGGDLQRLLTSERLQGRTPAEDQVASWIGQVALGLNALHRLSVIHRDVKPANCLLLTDGRIVLGDLGVSKILDTDHMAGTFLGTPHYMSPELMACKRYDTSSDVWALGVLAFEACTLQKPFAAATNMRALSARIAQGQAAWHLLRGSALEPMIRRCMHQQPHCRPKVDAVLRFPQITRAVMGFIRDLAAGRFSLRIQAAETLLDQIAALGLRAVCAVALQLGTAERRRGAAAAAAAD